MQDGSAECLPISKTIKGRINRLKELTKMEEEGVF